MPLLAAASIAPSSAWPAPLEAPGDRLRALASMLPVPKPLAVLLVPVSDER